MAVFPVDLEVSLCGKDGLSSSGSRQWGQDSCCIGYCVSGKGTFTSRKYSYFIEAGQCFVSFPGVPSVLVPDALDPWSVVWVCLRGATALTALKQAGVSERSPVFPWRDRVIVLNRLNTLIAEYEKDQPGAELRRVSHAYALLADLVLLNEESNGSFPAESGQIKKTRNYILDAVEYMKRNYHRKISIADLAQHVGLNRCYFSSAFRKTIGVSPQKYLIYLRLGIACDCLDNSLTSVSDVARAIGYEPLVFSQVFHQVMGLSPSAYRDLSLEARAAYKDKLFVGDFYGITENSARRK